MHADLILTNARVATLDPLVPEAEALAVRGGRILALGRAADIANLRGPATEVLDAGGRRVLPGFQDTHIHLQDGGLDLVRSLALYDVRSLPELAAALAGFAAGHSRPWVLGHGWQPGVFDTRILNRAALDAVLPDRPCLLYETSFHSACLNSAGLAALGIDRDTPDPPNGEIERDAAGVPTGMLHEDALYWARARMPEPTDADWREGVLAAQRLANRHGLTGVVDALVLERHVRVYSAMDAAGELTLRIGATARVEPQDGTAEVMARLTGFRARAGRRFRVHSAKFFFDGIFENRTAAMLAPYADDGGNAPVMFAPDRVRELFTALDAARFHIHLHTIGDGAVRAALDGLEAAMAANGRWPSLHQLAHVQAIDPADIPRFARLGAMANVQSLWAQQAPDLPDVAAPMLGPARGRWVYAFRSLVDAGAAFCLSSDWPVSTLNPFPILETAITRQPKGGTAPAFLPEQRLTRAEAIQGYTTHAAAAAWRGLETGSLTPGKSADLIVLDRDILTCDPQAIGGTEVLLTLLEGEAVHRLI